MPPWNKGTSGNPKGRPKKKDQANALVPVAPAAVVRHDGWEDLLTGLGQINWDKRSTTTFGVVYPVDIAYAQNLWRGNDLARKIIEKLPKEEIRAGFALTIQENDSAEGNADDASDRIAMVLEKWKQLKAIQKIRETRCFQRAYGGGGILLGANDYKQFDQPLNVAKVKEFNWITVLEPTEVAPEFYYNDPTQAKFGEVEYYRLTPTIQGRSKIEKAPSDMIIHESRLIGFPGISVSRTNYSGMITSHAWGDSVLTPIHEIIRDYGIGWTAAAMLLSDFSQAVYKMVGLDQLLSAETADDFVLRMRTMERSRSIARCIIIDKEEDFERKTTNLTGLPELLDEFKARVAAAADMPVTVLFGTSAKGLNATGEGDQGVWYDEVAGCREEFTIPALERITELCLQITGGIPLRWQVHGKPLHQMTEKEQAEIEKLHAEADSIRISDRVASPEEVAVSRYGGGAYSHSLNIDFDARDAKEAPCAPPIFANPPPGMTADIPSGTNGTIEKSPTKIEVKPKL